MNKRTFISSCILICLIGFAFADDIPKHSAKPEKGFVPDAKTATKIAVAIWEPIYGEKQIAKQKPYRAVLTNEIWIVEGTFHGTAKGGVAIAEIAKADGKILRVSHGK